MPNISALPPAPPDPPPDLVAMATEDLAGIGASLTAANAAAAVPTSGLLAAAGDAVSA
ncbi:PE domain-containing protein, partial [Mycobacterium tuberculosis]|uniref:PE domain-containing protein n=1 Tax=Mycobacterium tuberculosis TaxID=1773 RepID=UPI0015BC1892